MSKGINKVILVGNLGQEPELRYLESGTAVANVNLATNETWKDKESGELQQRTEWHRIVFFNRLAEIAGDYLHKGSQVYVEGSLRTRKWQDTEGIDRYTTEIVVNDMQMLGSAASNGVADMESSAEPAAKPGNGKVSKPAGKGGTGKGRAKPERIPTVVADDDIDTSDIPF